MEWTPGEFLLLFANGAGVKEREDRVVGFLGVMLSVGFGVFDLDLVRFFLRGMVELLTALDRFVTLIV